MAPLLKIIILSFVLFIQSPQSFCRGLPTKNNLKDISSKINNNEVALFEIKKKLKELEGLLGKKNESLLNTIKKREKLFIQIQKSKEENEKNLSEINSKEVELEQKYRSYLVNHLDDLDDIDGIIARKLTLHDFKLQAKLLSKLRNQLKVSSRAYHELKVKFNEYTENEITISSMLNDLELKKSKLVKKYAHKVKNNTNLKKRLLKSKSIKRKLKKSLVAGLSFISPLPDLHSFNKARKGLNLSYSGQRPILSCENGKVVYVGELSSYGQVIMIDHGKDIRSIILGDIVSKVIKGQNVMKSDVIGYTNPENLKSENLYFEIRKKNKAQNIFDMVDANILKKSVRKTI